VLPLTNEAPHDFKPEPVERLQYLATILALPPIAFSFVYLTNKLSPSLIRRGWLVFLINSTAIVAFILYTNYMMQQPLFIFYITRTNSLFFFHNFVNTSWYYVSTHYAAFVALMIYYEKYLTRKIVNITVSVICFAIVIYFLVDMTMFNYINFANLSVGGWLIETNAVLYSITQVYAGKYLLVNVFSQYGLFAWILLPVFRIIGLSTSSFSMVMGTLNAIGYFLLFLSLRRLIKNNLLSLAAFLAMFYWQFWWDRIWAFPVARLYYQYMPIRFFFPALAFYLVVVYHQSKESLRKWLLPIISVTASLAVFWNVDTGIIVFGTTCLYFLLLAYLKPTADQRIEAAVSSMVLLFGALIIVGLWFIITTKIGSGQFPDFSQFFRYQSFFYASGYFMLPMTVVQMWNIPALCYIAGFIYGAIYLKKSPDAPIVLFLSVLGCGIFVWFQGRSYDLNIVTVSYPAFLITAILLSKALTRARQYLALPGRARNWLVAEGSLYLFIPGMFIADGAASLFFNSDQIHEVAVHAAYDKNEENAKILKQKYDFLTKNEPAKDTVLILDRFEESFYYAYGRYYNPLHWPSSTEMFFKSELYELMNMIKAEKYPVFFVSANHFPDFDDSVTKLLALHSRIADQFPDHSWLYLKPKKGGNLSGKLTVDSNTIYYNNYGPFNRYLRPDSCLHLPQSFDIDLYMRADSSKMSRGSIVFQNFNEGNPSTGFMLRQKGISLDSFLFAYGNGSRAIEGLKFRLDINAENHVLIKFRHETIAVYVNGLLQNSKTINDTIGNNHNPFVLDPGHIFEINELKISSKTLDVSTLNL